MTPPLPHCFIIIIIINVIDNARAPAIDRPPACVPMYHTSTLSPLLPLLLLPLCADLLIVTLYRRDLGAHVTRVYVCVTTVSYPDPPPIILSTEPVVTTLMGANPSCQSVSVRDVALIRETSPCPAEVATVFVSTVSLSTVSLPTTRHNHRHKYISDRVQCAAERRKLIGLVYTDNGVSTSRTTSPSPLSYRRTYTRRHAANVLYNTFSDNPAISPTPPPLTYNDPYDEYYHHHPHHNNGDPDDDTADALYDWDRTDRATPTQRQPPEPNRFRNELAYRPTVKCSSGECIKSEVHARSFLLTSRLTSRRRMHKPRFIITSRHGGRGTPYSVAIREWDKRVWYVILRCCQCNNRCTAHA